MGVSLSPDRAYSLFSVKSVDEERRIIEGFASTPTTDRQGDLMESKGAQFTLPHPLLWQHNHDQPIGQVVSAKVTPQGIYVKAQIAKGVLPFIEEAWALIKAGLVRGFSVGWQPVEAERNKESFGLHVRKWLWLETSVVTVPANQQTSIALVKALDGQHRAAPGTRSPVPVHPPGASGSSKDRSMQVPISQQVSAAKAEIETKAARLQELMTQEDSDGALSAEELQEKAGLNASVKSLTDRLDTLMTLERSQSIQATGLAVPSGPTFTRESPKPRIEVPEVKLAKGIRFARYALAVAAGRGSYSDTLAYAKRWQAQTPEVYDLIKNNFEKAVAGSSVDESPGWGSELVYRENLVGEFIELLRAATVVDKLEGLRRVPPNVRIVSQTGGSTVNWVGEKAPKPVTELAFGTVEVDDHKIAGIVVITEELIRLGRPSAEETVRRDLVEQIARFVDEQFLDPAVAGGANNPASVTNGVSAVTATGDDADSLYSNLNTALASFDNVDLSTGNVYVVTTPALARGISTLRNALGQFEFPGMTPRGGTLMGFPVIVSSSVPAGYLILIKADEILVADEGGVRLDASNQATLDMAGGSSPTFSLWQNNCVGIRAERFITWKKRRAEAVAVISGATYGPSVGSPG